MDATIEAMTMEDYDAVLVFWQQQEGLGMGPSDERGPIEQFLSRNPSMSLVARDSRGKIIGAVLCGHDGRRGYLHHLAVGREHRRNGLGKALVEHCLAQLRAARISKCNIFLFDDNDQACRFWERMGYRSVNWNTMQRVIDDRL